MKKIVILATLSLLLSSTSFAVGDNSPDVIDSDVIDSGLIALSGTTIAFVSNTRADILISELNHEYERIESNNSFEDVDGITDPAVESILSTMNLQSTEEMSETELDIYLTSRFEIIDAIDRYTRMLPEWDRKIFFQNAQEYEKSLMTFD